MALTSASRISAMHCLDVRFMVKSEDAYILNFHKLHRCWRRNKAPTKLHFCKYSKDQELCVLSALDEFLKRTKNTTLGYRFLLKMYSKLSSELITNPSYSSMFWLDNLYKLMKQLRRSFIFNKVSIKQRNINPNKARLVEGKFPR